MYLSLTHVCLSHSRLPLSLSLSLSPTLSLARALSLSRALSFCCALYLPHTQTPTPVLSYPPPPPLSLPPCPPSHPLSLTEASMSASSAGGGACSKFVINFIISSGGGSCSLAGTHECQDGPNTSANGGLA